MSEYLGRGFFGYEQAYVVAGSFDLAVMAQACTLWEERSEWAARIAAQAEQGEASGASSQEEAQLLFPDDSAEIANPAEVQRATQAESTDPHEPVLACTGRDFAPGSHANAVDTTIITYSEPMCALGAAAGEPCSVCPINSRRGQVAGEAACESCIEDFSTAEERLEWAVRIAAQADQGGASLATSQVEAELLLPDSALIVNLAAAYRATKDAEQEPKLARTGRDAEAGSHADAVDSMTSTHLESMCVRNTAASAPSDWRHGDNTLSHEGKQSFLADARVICVEVEAVRIHSSAPPVVETISDRTDISSPVQGEREAQAESIDLQAPDFAFAGLGASHAGAVDSVPAVDKPRPDPKVDDSHRTMILASGEDEDEQPCLADARMSVGMGDVRTNSSAALKIVIKKIDPHGAGGGVWLVSWPEAQAVESAVESTNSDHAMGPASSAAACVPSGWTEVAEVAPSGQGPGRLQDTELPVTAEAPPSACA